MFGRAVASPLLNEIAFVHDMCSRKPGTGLIGSVQIGMLNAKMLQILSMGDGSLIQ